MQDNHKIFFLPTTPEEMRSLGWTQLDVIIVSADAYIDHPSFGAAIIGRFLQSLGLKVGIIPQPDWRTTIDFGVLGKPRLFFGVTAGNLDSMLNLYTSQRKIRSEDLYSEGGLSGKRPYLPTIVYSNRIKEIFPDSVVILGGIEASLRRIVHYDFYSDIMRNSILLDAKADLLVYGNGEAPLNEIVSLMLQGKTIDQITSVRGTVVPVKGQNFFSGNSFIELPSFETINKNPDAFLKMTKDVMNNLNPFNAKLFIQKSGTRSILINPPAFPLKTEEIDKIYDQKFIKKPHPRYQRSIPALAVVETSITSHRGCYGGCHFCGLGLHQGNIIQSRSSASICKEIDELLLRFPKLVISDIGGPTANMYGTNCRDENIKKHCIRSSCLFPGICKNLKTSHYQYMKLLESLRHYKSIKQISINSGIRTDLALTDVPFIEELVKYYVPGYLSAAPEHCDRSVLELMGKPTIDKFDKFHILFNVLSKKFNKKQYISPYFIVGHPGATDLSESRIKEYIKQNKFRSDQIQEFYPTPMTISTAIYWAGKGMNSGKSVIVCKKIGQKKKWKNFIQNKHNLHYK